MSANTEFIFSPPPSDDNSGDKAAAVISPIVSILILIGLICCCKKAISDGVANGYKQAAAERIKADGQNPKFTVVTDSELLEAATNAISDGETKGYKKAAAERNPKFPVVTDSELLEPATMERFLSEMAKEKPLRFSSQQLTAFTHNFSTRLGSGGFGVVYKGSFPDGVPLAVKVLNSNLGKRVEEQFMAEVATIGRTYHINLVRLYGFCFDANLQALVYEYMQNGSLDTLLFDAHKVISWEKLHEIALGTAKGITYLHEECQQRIIHYDIKPGNVLLDSNLSPKVADFGLAKLCNRGSTHVEISGLKGTPGYAAPEVWMPYPVTHKCDVYSFGMLLFEIVGRRRNHVGGDLSGTSKEWLPRWVYEKAVERGEVAEMMAELGIEAAASGYQGAERAAMVALWCVQYLPTARPNMSDVVRMLEGGVDIPHPPNPFAHLADVSLVAPQGSSTWTSTSAEGTIHTFPRILEKRNDIVAANATC